MRPCASHGVWRWRIFALPASLIFTVYRGFNTAISRPKAVMALQLGGLAGKVPLSIALVRERPDEVTFSCEDNGQGFDTSLRRQGLGLVGLRERVEALGGHFDLHSAPGRGTRVRASIPVKGKQ